MFHVEHLCPRCGIRPRRAPGKQCLSCHADYMRVYRQERGGEYSYLGEPAKRRARIRSMIRSRIRRGVLARPRCFRCGRPHDMQIGDYDHPMSMLSWKACRCGIRHLEKFVLPDPGWWWNDEADGKTAAGD